MIAYSCPVPCPLHLAKSDGNRCSYLHSYPSNYLSNYLSMTKCMVIGHIWLCCCAPCLSSAAARYCERCGAAVEQPAWRYLLNLQVRRGGPVSSMSPWTLLSFHSAQLPVLSFLQCLDMLGFCSVLACLELLSKRQFMVIDVVVLLLLLLLLPLGSRSH